MTGVVIFNPTDFKARFPEFTSVADGVLSGYFDRATLILCNSNQSPVRDLTRRTLLLDLLVAHITKLNATINGVKPGDLVGRINSATEGSVSGSSDMGPAFNSQAWFVQTRYGAEYWTATAIYRTFRYRPGASRPAPRVY